MDSEPELDHHFPEFPQPDAELLERVSRQLFLAPRGPVLGTTMAIGYLSLILHAHLPFVRHPEYPDFLEEDWLYEAISETYIPLLVAFNPRGDEGFKFRLRFSMPPPLCEMLCDPLLQERYQRHIYKLCE